jgi:hypothetical protein
MKYRDVSKDIERKKHKTNEQVVDKDMRMKNKKEKEIETDKYVD